MSAKPSPQPVTTPASTVNTGTEIDHLKWNLKLRDDALKARDAERDRLKEINAELVGVIEAYLKTADGRRGKPDIADVDDWARAALARAQGGTS